MMEPEAGSLPVLEADPGASPASCFLLRLLSTGATRERPRLGPWGWGWGCACTSSIFLMERRKHMGGVDKGQGHCQTPRWAKMPSLVRWAQRNLPGKP